MAKRRKRKRVAITTNVTMSNLFALLKYIYIYFYKQELYFIAFSKDLMYEIAF